MPFLGVNDQKPFCCSGLLPCWRRNSPNACSLSLAFVLESTPWKIPWKSLMFATIVRVEQHPAAIRLCKDLDVASGAPLTGLCRQAKGQQHRARAVGTGVLCTLQMSLSWGAKVAWLPLCLLHSNCSCPALGIAGAG